MRQNVANGLLDGLDGPLLRVGEPVVDPEPVAACVDETGSSEVCKVPGRFRLRDLETLVDMTDADLTGEEQTQDPEARRIRECLEERFDPSYLSHGNICLDKYNTTA